MKPKLKRYTKAELAKANKLRPKKSLTDWVDSGPYTIEAPKKYTIVYSECGNRGSVRFAITKFDRVLTNDLKAVLASEKYDAYTWFVFEGWPKQEGEK